MSKRVVTIAPDRTVAAALKVMARHGIGSLVVVKGGKPVGMVTERDFVIEISKKGAIALEAKVGGLASKPLITVRQRTEIWEAFTKMLRKKIRRLPVVDGHRLVGIVTERDLFKWVVMVINEPNVPEDVRKLFNEPLD